MENTNNALQVFNYGETPVRIVKKDGEPWFVAKDVCDVLGYTNSRKAIADHLDEDEKDVTNCYTLGGEQSMTIISESGVYTLIMRSNKPEAKKFRRWVTSEVLPAIRKTGGYINPRHFENEEEEEEENKLHYVSRGIMNSAKRVLEQALECKTEKDFQLTFALDRVFKKFTGKSALEMGGFKLKETCDIASFENVYYRTNERFEWEHDLPSVKK